LLRFLLAATYTVDPGGNGDATTVEEGFSLLEDGDTLYIEPGIYYETGLYLPAEETTIQGAGPDLTVFDGSMDETLFFWVPKGSVVSGISFEGAAGLYTSALQLDGDPESTTVIENCAFIGNSYALSLDGGGNTRVVDTRFVSNGYAVYLWYGARSVSLENNLFLDTAGGVLERSWQDDATCTLLEAHHNTIVGGTLGFDPDVCMEWEAGVANITNNVFAGLDGPPWSLFETYSGVVANNLIDPGVSAVGSGPGMSESDNLVAEVGFVAWSDDGDWSNDDFRLSPESAGIDLGTDVHASVTQDIVGVQRTLDGDLDGEARPDAGAYEFDPGTSDVDGDGFFSDEVGGLDCDDSDAGTFPGAEEVCGDGLDQDCDGHDADCGDSSPDSATGSPDSSPQNAGSPGGDAACGCLGAGGALLLVPGLLLVLRRRQP
jgi:hypothetical protein